MIAPDFVEAVQEQFTDQPWRVFVNFHNGENYVIAEDRRFENLHPHNMFLSCIESVADLQGVLTWAHNSAPSVAPVINIVGPRRWTHTVHPQQLWPLERPSRVRTRV